MYSSDTSPPTTASDDSELPMVSVATYILQMRRKVQDTERRRHADVIVRLCDALKEQNAQYKILLDSKNEMAKENQKVQSQLRDAQVMCGRLVSEKAELNRKVVALESKCRTLLGAQDEKATRPPDRDTSTSGIESDGGKIDYSTSDCSMLSSNGLQSQSLKKRLADLGPIEDDRTPCRAPKRPVPRSVHSSRENLYKSAREVGTLPPLPPHYSRRAPFASPEADLDEAATPRNQAPSERRIRGRSMGRTRSSGVRRSRSVPTQSPLERGEDRLPMRLSHAMSDEKLCDSDEAFLSEASMTTGNEEEETDGSCQDRTRTSYESALSINQGVTIRNRPHELELKRIMLRDLCDVCGRGIKFGATAVRCMECRQIYHRECEMRACVPCIPRPCTMKSLSGGSRFTLQQWCSATATPCVPFPLIALALHIERHHLAVRGLYRISGTLSTVANLVRDYRQQRSAPSLNGLDPETLTSAVKAILRDFKNPVILPTSHREFILAVRNERESDLLRAIRDLPRAHRETLAFLCLHLQKVAAHSEENNMPLENLATVFAPSLFGPSNEDFSNMIPVIREVLRVPADFFAQFVVCGTLPTATANGGTSTLRREMRPTTPSAQNTPSAPCVFSTPHLPKIKKSRKESDRPAWK